MDSQQRLSMLVIQTEQYYLNISAMVDDLIIKRQHNIFVFSFNTLTITAINKIGSQQF